jgi:hypothetical protein
MITLTDAAGIANNVDENYDYFKEYKEVYVFTSESYPDMRKLIIDKEDGSIINEKISISSEVIAEGNAMEKIFEERNVSPYHDARYYFEHDLLPRFFFENGLDFMGAIANKEDNVLNKVFLDILEKSNLDNLYGDNPIQIEPFAVKDIYIAHLTFPNPEDEPLCYETFMIYNIETNICGFYCIEKGSKENQRFLCEWTKETQHLNYGVCSNDTEEVIIDILKLFLNDKDKLNVQSSHTRKTTIKS